MYASDSISSPRVRWWSVRLMKAGVPEEALEIIPHLESSNDLASPKSTR